MTNLLHISASPRGAYSESLALATAFLESFVVEHPEVAVEHWDLWDGTLPAFGPAAVEAKMAVFAGAAVTGEGADAWAAARSAYERVAAADILLFSVPMWNHTVPYILKQLIDVVSQPGLLFGFDPVEGYAGLLGTEHAVALYTGAVWGPGRPASFGQDFLTPYFEDWLRWAGVADVASVRFQPNLVADDVEARRSAAHAEARALARTLQLRRAA